MTTWISASELAEMPGVPKTKSGVIRMATRASWRSRSRKGRGGGREYHISALPEITRKALIESAIRQAPAKPMSPPTATTSLLKRWQRECMEARAALLMEVERVDIAAGIGRAVTQLVDMASQTTLSEHLMALVPQANARSGGVGGRTLSVRTIKRWRALFRVGGVAALAPRSGRLETIPPWAPALLKQWRKPQKPSLADTVRSLHEKGGLPEGMTPPSYAQARRFLTRVGEVEKLRGRMRPRELKNLRPFVRRDTSQLDPADVYTADGHTFDAEVAHPEHGRPFRPEVTLVLDVATRRAVGWSASVAESSLTVLDALRHAVTTCGTPAILYVDNGSGYKNQLMTAPATGMMARLGCRMVHSLPYNSQARGVVERAHKTIFVQAAKTLPTFVGAAMDPQARKISFKRTRGDGGGLIRWEDFLTAIQTAVDTYNRRFHRSLPKVTDPTIGIRRHQTPLEAWESAASVGWSATMPVEPDDLFRPQAARLVRRGEVSLFGNVYFARELEEWHGLEVHVGYDVHDAARVWVRDLEGRLICVAEVDGNRTDYFPMSFVEQARELRAEGRARRLERHLEEVREELGPDHNFVPLPGAGIPEHLSGEVQQAHDQLHALFTEPVEPQAKTPPAIGKPPASVDSGTMNDQRALYRRWCALESLIQAGEVLHGRDLTFWQSFRNTPEFFAERQVHEAFGLSIHPLDEEKA